MASTEEIPPEATATEVPEVVTAPADAEERLRIAVTAALDHKAEELKVLDLAQASDFTDHFMICSGRNERQVQAIADTIGKRLRRRGVRPLHIEGYQHANWVLLDYGGDMVIHIFREETRRFYRLERLWADAPDVTERFAENPEPEAS